MILSALVRYYESLEKQGKLQGPGWGTAKVSDRILLDREGHLVGIISAMTSQKRGKKMVEVPTVMTVPEPYKRSSGVKPEFLCDTSSYFLCMDNKGKPKRTLECFEASRSFHHEVLDGVDSPAAKAVLAFFDHWGKEEADCNPIIAENKDEILSASNFIFQVEGVDAQKDDAIKAAWMAYRMKPAEDEILGQCLVTGKEEQPIARTHPNIKGVRDAQSSGAALVSFNAPAFESFGHEGDQGFNAPVSEYAAFAYTAALNYLIRERHCLLAGDTTVVYWSEHGNEGAQTLFGTLLGNDPPEGVTEDELKEIVSRLVEGRPADFSSVRISPDEPFYILGLAPNAARLSVRFFYRNTFGEAVKHVEAHQRRMRIVKPSWEKDFIPLWQLLKATVNPKSKDRASSPLLAGSLMRSILGDTKYPEALFQNIMLRVFSDQDDDDGIHKVTYVKAAFIKAYLLKNSKERWGETITMTVNENCKEISYVLGRLFAVLEGLQQKANPNITTTIKDRYFNSACATPATVFPTLLKLANAHLNKLDKSWQVYYSKKMGDLISKISMPDEGAPIPSRLTLEEQGVFVLGYYQETQDRFAKKEEN